MTLAELKQHCINTINKNYLSDKIREEHELMLKIIKEGTGVSFIDAKEIIHIQSCKQKEVFARAYVKLCDWLIDNCDGY